MYIDTLVFLLRLDLPKSFVFANIVTCLYLLSVSDKLPCHISSGFCVLRLNPAEGQLVNNIKVPIEY